MSLAKFVDVVFPKDIAFQSGGGPEFNTAVVTTGGGKMVRLQRWSEDLQKYDILYGIHETAKIQTVLDFFSARRGKYQGFLFFFHEDHIAEDVLIGTGNGVLDSFQLVKLYFDEPARWYPTTDYVVGDSVHATPYDHRIYVCIAPGISNSIAEPVWNTALGDTTSEGSFGLTWSTLQGPDTYTKTIEKPIPGTVVIRFDGITQSEGVDYLVNYSTGTITTDGPVSDGVEITADFQFYRKVNFDIDHLQVQGDLYNGGSIRSIPLIEGRV